MKEYIVVFSLKPAVRLPAEIEKMELNFEEPEKPKRIIISKIEDILSGYKIQSGLQLRVFVKNESLKEAIDEAKSLADGIVSFITLVSGVGLDIPKEELAYEITPDVEERDFLKIFHEPIHVPISRRNLDYKLLKLLIDKVMKLIPYKRDRVGRAIQWYRIGSIVSNIFDKFICFWIGLETLNPVFQEKFLVKDDPVKCPSCGHEWVPTPTVSGIRTFIQTKIQDGKELYKRLHTLRINLIHSREKLYTLYHEASDLVPKIAEILFRAICFLVEIEDWDKISYKGILESVPLHIELETTLIGGESGSLGPANGCDPFFEPDHQILKISEEENKIIFEADLKFTARINPNVKWRPREIRIYGDREITGSITKMEV